MTEQPPRVIRLIRPPRNDVVYADHRRAAHRLFEPGLWMAAEDRETGRPRWQIIVNQRGYPDDPMVRMEIFTEGFEAFGSIPEFFETLRLESPSTLDHVLAILRVLGYRQVTR